VDEPTDQGGGAALIETRSTGSAEEILVVVPSDVGGSDRVAPGTPVAGLPLIRRIVLAAERAGWKPLVAGFVPSAVSPWLVGTAAEVLAPGGEPLARSPRRVLFLPMTVIPQLEWLRRLREMPVDQEQLYAYGASALVVETAEPGATLAAAARCGDMGEAAAALRALFKTADRSVDAGDRFVLASARDLPAAETWLLQSLIKPTEGFMSRHFERRISLAITRRLCPTAVTPNVMTLVSLAVGLVGAPFFLSSAPGYQLAGALLFLTHSILDGCDGELARLKFLESRWGAVLDVAGDNLVHSAVFACMGVGWSLHLHSGWPILLGGVAIASTLSIAAVVYGRGMRASTDGGPSSAVSRVADVVVFRDFIYLIVLLAAFGQAHWFVALSAVGAPVFLLLLAWLGRRR
jgi:phosphatidylglycerophosphate synthase